MDGPTLSLIDVDDERVWSETVTGLSTSHPYTSWPWGEYKRRMAWDVRRVCVMDAHGNGGVGCFQLQKKTRGPVTILLIQGGIHLKQASDDRYHEVLTSLLSVPATARKPFVVIINHQASLCPDAHLGLLRCGFSPIVNSKMFTFVLDETGNAIGGEALSRNWRHNLKRARNNTGLSVTVAESPADRADAMKRLEAFYATLTNRKLFASAIDFDRARDIIVANKDFHIIEATCGGQVIAGRVGLICGDHAMDFLAASGEASKNTYANYLLLSHLFEMARRAGARFFDCGGIDPAASMGVYNFKKGLGGRLALNGPMWVYASNAFLRRAARLALSWKH